MTSQELYKLADEKKQEEIAQKHGFKPQIAKLKHNIYSGEYIHDLLESMMNGDPTQPELDKAIERLKNIEPLYEKGQDFCSYITDHGIILWKPKKHGYHESFHKVFADENLEIIN